VSATWWLATAQTVVFLAACGWAYFVTIRVEDANDAARDTNELQAESTEILRAWWNDLAIAESEQPPTEPMRPVPHKRTDTAEVATVITPQAVIGWHGDEGRVHDVSTARAAAEHEQRIRAWRERNEQVRTGSTARGKGET
jgi:hypothetical protein